MVKDKGKKAILQQISDVAWLVRQGKNKLGILNKDVQNHYFYIWIRFLLGLDPHFLTKNSNWCLRLDFFRLKMGTENAVLQNLHQQLPQKICQKGFLKIYRQDQRYCYHCQLCKQIPLNYNLRHLSYLIEYRYFQARPFQLE